MAALFRQQFEDFKLQGYRGGNLILMLLFAGYPAAAAQIAPTASLTSSTTQAGGPAANTTELKLWLMCRLEQPHARGCTTVLVLT